MLTVLYDAQCNLCQRARSWLERQPKYVPLEFMPAGSEGARRRFPGLDPAATLVDLTVVGAGGEVYRGAKAWVMCLWALKEHRETALRLSAPALMPIARQTIDWLSRNRFRLGSLLEAPPWTGR
jgi:predicted DCC family thiol-disulfide oxidoreductase YuxK